MDHILRVLKPDSPILLRALTHGLFFKSVEPLATCDNFKVQHF